MASVLWFRTKACARVIGLLDALFRTGQVLDAIGRDMRNARGGEGIERCLEEDRFVLGMLFHEAC